MDIIPGRIYLLDRPRLRASTCARPRLVLEVDAERITIAYFSTQLELKSPRDLTIDKLDEGFEHTGLTQSSFLIADQIVKVRHSDFLAIREMGHIASCVKELVEDWYGMPLK